MTEIRSVLRPVSTSLCLALSMLVVSEPIAVSWSPDGKQLAFSFIGGPENIYLVNVDGTGSVPLVVREQTDFRPEWAPDGSHLVFTSVVDGAHVLMRVNPDGTGLRQISRVEEAAADPDYSPDGGRLLYFTDDPLPRALFVRDVKTGKATALTSTADFQEYSGRWAPDGHRIAFVGKLSGEGVKGDIWILDSRSGKRSNLTSSPAIDEFHPEWSHDGSRVIYIRNADGQFSVGMRNIESGEETIVADGNGFAVLSPHFSPDDRSVTFARTDFAEKGEGMPAIVRVSLDDRRETTIVKGLYLTQIKPRTFQFGQSVVTLRPLLDEDCDLTKELSYRGERAAPFDEQTQIDCSGLQVFGARHEAEFLFDDGPLGHIWIHIRPEQVPELRKTLEMAFGPVVFRTETYKVFASGTVALRLDPPEILVATPALIAELTGYRKGHR